MPAMFANGFEAALIGVGHQFNTQLAVYDWDKCVDILQERDHMEYDEAIEFMDFNVLGAWVGRHTPVFVRRGKKTQCDSCGETFDEERDGFAVTNLEHAMCFDCEQRYEEKSFND
jgi:hypothetical protein